MGILKSQIAGCEEISSDASMLLELDLELGGKGDNANTKSCLWKSDSLS